MKTGRGSIGEDLSLTPWQSRSLNITMLGLIPKQVWRIENILESFDVNSLKIRHLNFVKLRAPGAMRKPLIFLIFYVSLLFCIDIRARSHLPKFHGKLSENSLSIFPFLTKIFSIFLVKRRPHIIISFTTPY